MAQLIDVRRQEIARRAERFCAEGPARAVLVRSLAPGSSGVEVDVAGDSAKPAASTIKLLIAEAACALRLELGAEVAVADLGRSAYPTILSAYAPDRTLLLAELLSLSLMTSDNAAANHVVALLGMPEINRRATELGLAATVLRADFSDANLGAAGLVNTSSARDLALLLTHLYHSRDRDPSYGRVWRALLNNLRNDCVPALLPDDVPVAHKTGRLPGVVNDAAVVVTPEPYVLVVLTEGESSRLEATHAIAHLSSEVYTALGPA